MKYDLNIREENFGATLNDIEKGKREYITKSELHEILNHNKFPEDSIAKRFEQKKPNIKFVPVSNKDEINNFSFADIVFLELTRGCNLNCKHCLNSSGKVMKNQLNKLEFTKLIDDLAAAGVQEIRFTGGEPLLFNGIIELIKQADDLGIYTSIGTNGTLIDKNLANKLKKAGLKKAVVSIDGTKEKHDSIRGIGSYEKAFMGLKYLIEENINVRVNSVIFKSNMKDVIKLAKQLNLQQIPLFIRRFIESGRAEKMQDEMLTASQYELVKKELEPEINCGPYVNGHYLRNDEGIVSRIPLGFEIKGCKAGQRAIAIMPDGEIQLCGFLAAQGFPSVGNIRNIKNWASFWKELQSFDKLAYLRKNLDKYNETLNVQTTYCLAYIQRYLNKGEK